MSLVGLPVRPSASPSEFKLSPSLWLPAPARLER